MAKNPKNDDEQTKKAESVAELAMSTDTDTSNPKPNRKKAEELFNKGLEFSKTGDTDKAEKLHNQAIEADPSYANPYNTLGVIYDEKDNNQAIEYYNKAVFYDPLHELAVGNLISLYNTKGDDKSKALAKQVQRNYDKALQNSVNTNTDIKFIKNGIELKFHYTEHKVPAHVLATYLTNYANFISDVSKYKSNTHEVVVEAVTPGSVEIFMQFLPIAGAMYSISNNDLIELAKDIFNASVDIMDFVKNRQKQNPKQTIRTEDGDTFTFNDAVTAPITINKNIYNYVVSNPNSIRYISNMNKATQNEEGLVSTSLSLYEENKQVNSISITQEEAKELAKLSPDVLETHEDQIVHTTNQEIKLTKINFLGKKGWGMFYDNKMYPVDLSPEVLNEIKKLSISEKDTFTVDISIIQKYNEQFGEYIDSKYLINYLHKHKPFEENFLPFEE